MMNHSLPSKGEKVYEKVRAYLQAFISKNPAGSKLPTYMELNQVLGAKQSAVERVLQELSYQGLIDRNPRRGIYVSEQAKKSYIGVVFGYGIMEPIASPFWNLLMLSLRTALLQRGYEAKIYIENNDLLGYKDARMAARELVSDIESGRLKGVIIGQPGVYHQFLSEAVERTRKPAVSLFVRMAGADCFSIELGKMIYQGIDELAGLGARRIAVIAHDFFWTGSPLTAEMLSPIQNYLSQKGCASDERYFSCFEASRVIRRTHQETGAEVFRLMLERFTPEEYPDGIVVTDDMTTRGIMPLLGDYQLWPGKNIHIASLVNKGSPTLMGFEDNMVRMEIDPFEMPNKW
ncbi:GntR family transcriptional regulator [Oscillatoria laete-virens NRMC-F 0139]|nr:GntR family transcriptional regulator [Oscillatoria laete-virens]MDL5053382.1 GntR family transcriptional regulator [Oscillatoria laete-virens NRMC-F 0139]